MTDELIKLILKTIGEEVSEKQGLSEKRKDEYKKIFGEFESDIDVDSLYQTMNLKSTSDQLVEIYLDKIFSSNQKIQKYRDAIDIKSINSIVMNTKTVSIDGSRHLITFDSHIKTFIWMMNKGFLYGGIYLKTNDNLQLFYELFLHFGSIAAFNEEFAFPKPITPKHQDLQTAKLLHIYTEIQEIFLLSHEIAHILIRNNDHEEITQLLSTGNYLMKNIFNNIETDKVQEEILADEIAFDLTLNVYNRESSEAVEFVCSAIFILIRYFLWLRFVHKEQQEDFEFKTWLARNSFLREKIRHVYTWSGPVFVRDILEVMEERMEPAALAAAKTIKLARNTINAIRK